MLTLKTVSAKLIQLYHLQSASDRITLFLQAIFILFSLFDVRRNDITNVYNPGIC